MVEILQNEIPAEMAGQVRLPGVTPCGVQDWLRVDGAYGAQMAYREALLARAGEEVVWLDPAAKPAACELLEECLKLLPALGFDVLAQSVICPDGRDVAIDRARPLHTLGALVQEDICILQKQGEQHVLSGAIVCFPASWRLADKVGKPLGAIHAPVDEYDPEMARRVQRLFDGVQVGRPLWRFNRLSYAQADLHQPRRANEDTKKGFIRSERQCILRLPISEAVVFTIHTYVVAQQQVD